MEVAPSPEPESDTALEPNPEPELDPELVLTRLFLGNTGEMAVVEVAVVVETLEAAAEAAAEAAGSTAAAGGCGSRAIRKQGGIPCRGRRLGDCDKQH